MEERFEKVERFVKEEKRKEEGNIFIAIIVGVLLTVICVIFITSFGLDTNQTIIFILLIVAFYIITLSFLFEHRLIREIINTITRTVEKPSEEVPNKVPNKEVVKRFDRPVFYELEKPIIRDVIRIVERPVFVKGERLNIPRYDYIGSSETKNYHKKSCRFGKLIKKKYKVLNNDPKYFVRNGFSPCKVCILKKKKV